MSPRERESAAARAPLRHPGPSSAAFVRLPRFARGQAIGLLGGSFNPPHDGHRLISELALHRLRLDRLWWLATPGNPLKSGGGPDRDARAARSRGATGPRPPDHDHRLRGRNRFALHLGHDRLVGAASGWRALRLDHGRRQFEPVSSLASLASHRRSRADSRRGSPRLDVAGPGQPRGARPGAISLARKRRADLGEPRSPRLRLPAWASLEPILDRAAPRREIGWISVLKI